MENTTYEDTMGLYIRQTGLIDPTKLSHKILIIGAGSIGGWTALCLGKLGCQDITVMDFDNVEIHNAGSQIYKASDDGTPKVEALELRLGMLLENSVKVQNTKWTPREDLSEYDIIIAATDNITVRKDIFESVVALQKPNQLYIDARMASNSIEIYTVKPTNERDVEFYAQSLFPEEETLPIPCSERSVVYNVFSVASWIGVLIAKWANEEELPNEVEIDLRNFRLYTTFL